ncbi:MAG: YfiT family bacillithiol transferase [Bacteroidota bacterium]
MDLEHLKYPIGKYQVPEQITPSQIENWIDELGNFPAHFRAAVEHLSDQQLDTPYRPKGWTVRQVVHHVPDSHMNAYIRFKLALTEDNPTIRPYFEDRWAEIADSKSEPIQPALILLEGLHQKWAALLQHCTASDFDRTFFHPESQASSSLAFNIGNYVWHGNHHMAQITGLKERMGW